MLRGIRKASANWLGRVVLLAVVVFLVFSFALWGIGDIFRGFGQNTVATVGKTEISIETFRRLYNEQLQQMARQAGRPIPPEEARAMGLETQLLGRLIAEGAFDEQAKAQRLGVTDAYIAEQITADPAFRGAGGGFDKFVFEQVIRQAGYTEATYVAEQKRIALRRQIADATSFAPPAPAIIGDAVHRFQSETRDIATVTIGAAKAGDIPAPSDAEAAAYFEERKVLFRAPEYRKVVVLRLTAESLAQWIEVSDADARALYDQRRDRYATPERRQVLQIKFDSMADAQAASARLKGGLTFEALAEERKLGPADIDLGLVAKAGLVDRAVADAAFALAEGGVSDPVQGRFGVAILKVTKVEAGSVQPFETVADEIKKEIAAQRAQSELNATHDKVEDERAAGQNLTEIAQKLGLTVETIEAVDRSGRDPTGAAIEEFNGQQELLRTLFTTGVGVEIDPVQLQGRGFIWADVAGITPARERTLDEVKDRVIERWRADRIAARLKEIGDAFLARVKAGTALTDLAAAEGLDVRTATGLRRIGANEGTPPSVVQLAFRTPSGETALAEDDANNERILVQVTAVNLPPRDPNDQVAVRVEQEIRRTMEDDLLAQYVVRLQTELGTTINREAVQRVVGGVN